MSEELKGESGKYPAAESDLINGDCTSPPRGMKEWKWTLGEGKFSFTVDNRFICAKCLKETLSTNIGPGVISIPLECPECGGELRRVAEDSNKRIGEGQ